MTNELVERTAPLPALAQDAATHNLIEWAKAAHAANELATPLVRTTFVPAHFQGRPGDATAAILYGAEAGLSPLQALQGIYVIGGKPAMYARTLMAVTLGQGHQVWTEELTDTRAIVCGKRRGSEHVERVVWTMDRAKKAGYTKNGKYASDPQSMLLARAQADVCRRIAPDALLGMAYTVEELEDEAPPATRTVSRAETPKRTAQRAKAEPEPDPEPPLEPEPEPVAEDAPDADEFITGPQSKLLHKLLNDSGRADRDAGLAYIAGVLGHTVESTRDLTKAQASQVIDALGTDPVSADDADGSLWGQS